MHFSMTNHAKASAKSLLIAALISHLSCVPGALPSGAANSRPAESVERRFDLLTPPLAPSFATPVGPATTVRYSARTTDDGASEITIPIWTPAGRKGIEPKLAVIYNSRAGKGLLGLGANLTGFGQVTRCWKSIAQDGALSTSEAPDEFCLDGKRLIRHSQNPREFRLEGEPSVKLVSSGGTTQSPGSFELRTSTGLICGRSARSA